MSKPKSRQIALLVFALGFGLLIVGIFWLFFERSLVAVPNGLTVATTDFSEGEVQILRQSTAMEITPIFGEKIYNLDKIKTGPKSALIFTTLSGNQIRVDENSIAIIERASDKDLITVLSGQAHAIKHNGSLEIQNTREKWRTAYLGTSIHRQEVAPKTPESQRNNATPPRTMPEESNSHDVESLKLILDGQKTYFNRCFAKLLIQNPTAQGEIILGFLLLPHGKVDQVKVLSSSLPDPELEKCLTSVIQRSPFRRFAGEPISVTYPIRLE